MENRKIPGHDLKPIKVAGSHLRMYKRNDPDMPEDYRRFMVKLLKHAHVENCGNPNYRTVIANIADAGLMELFRECGAMPAPVLPAVGDEDALAISSGGWMPALEELCLHTKTQWRWNRPAYAFEDGGHLGVELRSLPAGPSVGDMIANAAFATGLAYALAPQIEEHLCCITFGQARRSFFAAARDGLEAELAWPAFDGLSPRPRRARDLVMELLPLAAEGLASLGVEDDEAHELLGIIERRASSGQTGSVWQVSAVTALERRMSRDEALRKMLVAYVRRASTGQPVHSWAPLDEHREGGPT